MSSLRNEVSKLNIRGELNLLFSMSKMIVSIIDAAEDNRIACDTLRSVADALLNQAAYVCGKVNIYADDQSQQRVSTH